jgi:hypothetical protein
VAKLADAIALGAIGETLGGSNPLPPITAVPKIARDNPMGCRNCYRGLGQFIDDNGSKWWFIIPISLFVIGVCAFIVKFSFSLLR